MVLSGYLFIPGEIDP